jgi:ribose transport system substrate-binding protein
MVSKIPARFPLTFAALALTLGLGFFAKSGHSDPAPKPRANLKLAFVTNNPSDYWTIARAGVEQAERELGIHVEFITPANGTAAEQTQLVQGLLGRGVDGIAISPVDPVNQTDIINRAAKRTLVFTQDADVPGSKRACYIGTDNVAAGRQAGEQLKRVLPRGGKVMAFVGRRDVPNAIDRLQGLQDAIKNTKIQLIGVRVDNADRSRAKSNVSDALIQHPDLAACVGIWSYNGPAILSAVRDARKTGKVKIVCFDEENETLEGIRHGQISATIVQQPYQFGYLSVINMAKVLSGDQSVIPANHRLFVPTLVVSQNNEGVFKQNLDQMRNRHFEDADEATP